MKKEISDNVLKEKMEAFNEANTLSARNYQPVWDKLEDRLHSQNKRKAMHLYFAAAAIFLVMITALTIRFQLNVRPAAQLKIQNLSGNKKQEGLPSNTAPNTLVHSLKPDRSRHILNNSSRKKSLKVLADKLDTEVIMVYKDDNSNLSKQLEEVSSANVAEQPAATLSQMNAIVVPNSKRRSLKILHINEIDHGNDLKPYQPIKDPSVNWLFTSNKIDLENREAENNYLPDTRKKSFFSIPLQKQNSNYP